MANLTMCADEHPTITFDPDFHEGRCPLCRAFEFVDELQLSFQLVRQERDRLMSPIIPSAKQISGKEMELREMLSHVLHCNTNRRMCRCFLCEDAEDLLGIAHPRMDTSEQIAARNLVDSVREEVVRVDELRIEIEQQYQNLCGKAQLGGAATLDDLADVAGNIARMMQVVSDSATAIVRLREALG